MPDHAPCLIATYRIAAAAQEIESRAQALAVEQSVEMPLDAITDATVLNDIVAEILSITQTGPDSYDVALGIASATVGAEAGQLLNMLFGNSSIHPDLTLTAVEFPPDLADQFGGPRHGVAGLRARVGADARPLTCSALKPQGTPPAALAQLAERLALGGIDYIKDDHGIADQPFSPFADRVPRIAEAVSRAASRTGIVTRYAPSLSGDLDRLREQIDIMRTAGVDCALIAPMIVGLPAFHRVVRDAPDIAFIAHPALAGAGALAPSMLLGTIFRIMGADATIFPNHGGRFGYSPETCRAVARAARSDWPNIKPSMPVPAGGMAPARAPEMLDFYGRDVMLLIGGALLAAGDRVTVETARFVSAVRDHRFETSP